MHVHVISQVHTSTSFPFSCVLYEQNIAFINYAGTCTFSTVELSYFACKENLLFLVVIT